MGKIVSTVRKITGTVPKDEQGEKAAGVLHKYVDFEEKEKSISGIIELKFWFDGQPILEGCASKKLSGSQLHTTVRN